MYQKLKPYLFKFDPENMHNACENLLICAQTLPFVLEIMAKNFCVVDERLQQNLFGLKFYNPIGLAAGFDKNATMIKALCALGFGHLELGTITPKPQDGNPKPRLFRHIDEKSIQNAMGFNNDGGNKILNRIQRIYPFAIPLGINIGKNKITEEEKTIGDYKKLITQFSAWGDYFTINLSSPNTPRLRDLQNEEFIKSLFNSIRALTNKPILLKISPDMDIDYMLNVCECAIDCGANGIIATNTTINYNLIKNPQNTGGISGEALKNTAREILRILGEHFYKKTIIISVGGINSGDEAYSRIKLGANLIQIYSSMIYEGPKIINEINKDLIENLNNDGFNNISEAVGCEVKK